MGQDKKVSIILPTLDEAENIIPLIKALTRHTPDLEEILVVDDASKDATAQLVDDYARTQSSPSIRAIRRTSDFGLTNSLKEGIQQAKGGIIVWLDCDFSMPPELVPDLVRLVQNGTDIAVGSRFIPGGSFKQNTDGTKDSWLAVFLSRMMNYSIQLLLDHRFKNYTNGFIAIRRNVFDRITLRGDYGEYFIDLIYRALCAGYSFKEIPYVCVPRQVGYSKTGQNILQYLKRGSKYIQTALALRFNLKP